MQALCSNRLKDAHTNEYMRAAAVVCPAVCRVQLRSFWNQFDTRLRGRSIRRLVVENIDESSVLIFSLTRALTRVSAGIGRKFGVVYYVNLTPLDD